MSIFIDSWRIQSFIVATLHNSYKLLMVGSACMSTAVVYSLLSSFCLISLLLDTSILYLLLSHSAINIFLVMLFIVLAISKWHCRREHVYILIWNANIIVIRSCPELFLLSWMWNGFFFFDERVLILKLLRFAFLLHRYFKAIKRCW